ncbi:MAG: hypothetical protein K2H86_02290 [Muribaculaceae bacterium]|nr:hypothetical protein [Muribaculaceae bacterium]
MSRIKFLSLGLFLVLGYSFSVAQSCKAGAKRCGEDNRPRPTCGAPYPAPVCEPECDPECSLDFESIGRPSDPNKDPYRNLNITEKQKAEIQKAIDKRNAKAAKTRERMQKDREKAQKEFDKSIKKILTPFQYGQFRQNIGDAKVRRYVGKPVPGPQPQIMK